jgi:hypothetical protein
MKTYKFVFVFAGTGKTKDITAENEEAAWNKVSSYIINDKKGRCRATYCISIDGVNTGILSNFNSLFTPKNTDDYYHPIKADDLQHDWKNLKKEKKC